ncbi:MAG: hypothetical protein ACR2QE_07755 [Acidimicrobiales bacterium]
MTEPSTPDALDVGATHGWVFGCCVTAFCLGFAASVLFELVIYDIPEVATWWDFDALFASLCAWISLMVVSASRLRIDLDGIHQRSLLRRRSWAWNQIEELGSRPPRIAMVSAVLAFRTLGRWHLTPWGINSHPGGAERLLELAAPLAAYAGVPVAGRESIPVPTDS